MRPTSLTWKVGLYMAVALTVTMLLFTLLIVRHHRDQLIQGVIDHVTQLSEVITKSTRFAMLRNQPLYVYKIIEDVGRQAGIDRVRLLSKEGSIIYSTYPAEIGRMVDRRAEACFYCHESEQPLDRIPEGKRARIFNGSGGGRRLGGMEVIRNEPACGAAGCHPRTDEQSVLGILDIVYSLEGIDRTLRTNTLTIFGFSLAFIVVASLCMSYFVHRIIHVPLRDLETGAQRISAGDLEQLIPVRGRDDFGRLAASFNAMTVALKESQLALRDWGRTLEDKVAEKTRALRVAEAESAQREKLASVGLLAAGIAHELNNPLTGVLTFSHLIRKKMPEGSQEAEDLDLVIGETKRCSTIIRRLLDFAREKRPEKSYTDLNRIAEETARFIERPAYLRDIRLTMDLDRDLPPAWVDADQIRQVIMNMLVNAEHAIQDSGTITIRSRHLDEGRSPEPGAAPTPMVEISIIDTGCGIPERDLQRIFDPFFTSKGVGKGTGLGLSVSHGIIRAHGGEIEVESTVGAGSTFRLYLPLETAEAEAAGAIDER